MKQKDECIQLIQSTINLLEASRLWEDKAMLKAQSIGLQGEKRRERLGGSKNYNLRKYLQCLTQDLFGLELEAENVQINIANINKPREYFILLKDKLWTTYHEMHEMANKLVVMGYSPIAKPIKCQYNHLFNEIIEIQRFIKEGDMFGWSDIYLAFLLKKETHDYNVHDEKEVEENKHGYHY